MEDFMREFNRLQEVISVVGRGLGPVDQVDVPRIVVVGGQKNFLPRGNDTVTRTPIELQLKYTSSETEEFVELSYDLGEGSNCSSFRKIIRDFKQVSTEIKTATDKITGGRERISTVKVILKVFSPNVPDLTLVDLPGLIEVPVDMKEQIEQLISEYIEQPNTIILAVCHATTDLKTAKALSLAKKHDPTGKRTVCVVTKLDKLDGYVKVPELLDAEELSGFMSIKVRKVIGVVNVSQANLDDANWTYENRLILEENYFRKYRGIARDHGTRMLTTCLAGILREQVRRNIPRSRTTLDQLVTDNPEQLTSSLPRRGNFAPGNFAEMLEEPIASEERERLYYQELRERSYYQELVEAQKKSQQLVTQVFDLRDLDQQFGERAAMDQGLVTQSCTAQQHLPGPATISLHHPCLEWKDSARRLFASSKVNLAWEPGSALAGKAMQHDDFLVRSVAVTKDDKDNILQEADFFMAESLLHSNIVKFFGVRVFGTSLQLVMEYSTMGTLFDVIRNFNPHSALASELCHEYFQTDDCKQTCQTSLRLMNEKLINVKHAIGHSPQRKVPVAMPTTPSLSSMTLLRILYQICSGLVLVEEHDMLNRNLTLSTVLISNKFVPKLLIFGNVTRSSSAEMSVDHVDISAFRWMTTILLWPVADDWSHDDPKTQEIASAPRTADGQSSAVEQVLMDWEYRSTPNRRPFFRPTLESFREIRITRNATYLCSGIIEGLR